MRRVGGGSPMPRLEYGDSLWKLLEGVDHSMHFDKKSGKADYLVRDDSDIQAFEKADMCDTVRPRSRL